MELPASFATKRPTPPLSQHQLHLKNAAYELHDLGANIVPISNTGDGKKPTNGHIWQHLQFSRQERANLYKLPFYKASGIAIVCGYTNWRCVDMDGCKDIAVVNEFVRILGLPLTYSYIEQTGNGYHVWLYCTTESLIHAGIFSATSEQRPLYSADNSFDHIDLRWKGLVNVAPSHHIASQKYYTWLYGKPSGPPTLVEAQQIIAAARQIAPSDKRLRLKTFPAAQPSAIGELSVSVPKLLPVSRICASFDELRQCVIETLQNRPNSRLSDDWIEHSCLLGAEYHKNGDRNPSAHFNTQTGYDHCKNPNCPANQRALNTIQVGELLGFKLPHVNKQNLPARHSLRRKHMNCVSIAQLLDGMAICNKGQEVWSRTEIVSAGQHVQLTENKVDKAIKATIEAGYLTRERKRGMYRVTELGYRYFSSQIPTENNEPVLPFAMNAYASAKSYRLALLKDVLETECSAQGIESEKVPTMKWIARSTGLSVRSIFRYENELQVQRYKIVERSEIPMKDRAIDWKLLSEKGGFWWFQVVNAKNERLRDYHHASRSNTDKAEERMRVAYAGARDHAQHHHDSRIIIARNYRLLRRLPDITLNFPSDATAVFDEAGNLQHLHVDNLKSA